MKEPEDLKRVRDRVVQLARQIEELANSKTTEEIFFPEFLRRVVSSLGAQGGAVWLRTNNRVDLAYEVNLAQTGFRENPQSDRLNQPLLGEVFSSGQATLYGAGEPNSKPTPTPHLYILAPLQKGKEVVGAVEIFQRAETPTAARAGYLQFVEQMSGYASRYIKLRAEGGEEAAPADFFKEFNRFTIDLQRGLNVPEIANTAANDGRQLIRCDRVSIAVRRSNQIRIVAISGQDSVNRKANLVRMMEALTDSVIATGEPLSYTGKLEDYPPQIEKPLADYVHESGSRCVMIIPLFPSDPLIDNQADARLSEKKKVKRKVPLGAMVVEQVAESRPRAGMTERIKLVSDHTSAALSNALVHQRLFLLPLWRLLGETLEQLRGRTLLKVVAAVTAATALVLALILFPYEYRVEGKGRLMPVVQQQIFAPWEGQVVKVFVQSGDRVKPGDKLVQLWNEDLQARLVEAQNQYSERQQLVGALRAEYDEAQKKGARDEEVRILGKIEQTKIESIGAQTQVKILKEQVEKLTVRSPIGGQVPTFQVEQLLINRPVQRGEVLLEVMDVTQPWRLELQVPEYRLGHMLHGQKVLSKHELPVEFVLATSTEFTYDGEIQEVSTRSDINEEGSVVEVYAKLNPEVLTKLGDQLRIGAEVRAKIHCGERSLGYVLFGDVVEFIQTRLWF
jgi:soluble P-type ATPase